MTTPLDPQERQQEYWETAASGDFMNAICDGVHDDRAFAAQPTICLHPALKLDKTKRLLDLGCGVGRIVPIVAPLVREYVGVDISPGMLKLARERNHNCDNARFLHVKGDGHLPIEISSSYFEAAIAQLLFQHVTQSQTVNYAQSVLQSLKTDGVFLADFPKVSFYKKYGYTHQSLLEIFPKDMLAELQSFSEIPSINPLIARRGQDAYFLMKVTKASSKPGPDARPVDNAPIS